MRSPSEELYEALDDLHQKASSLESQLAAVKSRRETRVLEFDGEIGLLEVEIDQVDAAIKEYESAIRLLTPEGSDA